MNKIKNNNVKYYLIVYTITIIIPKINFFTGTMFSLWINIFRYCFLGIISIFLFKELYKDSAKSWKSKPVKCIVIMIVAFILDLIFGIISQIPLGIINPDYVSTNANNILKSIRLLPAIILLPTIGILGPITEEIIFRGILVGKLSKKVPTWICIIISSALFMIMHVHSFNVEDFLSCLPHFFTGVIYSVVFVKTKNISIPMILHILNNFPAILSILF